MRLLYTIIVCALASQAIAAPPPQPKPGVVTQKKMHEAAMVLMDAMNADNTLQKQLETAVNAQVEGMREIPCADRAMGDIRNILNNAMSYNAMKDEIANVYANNFTLEELNWMVDFYKTPLGTKLLKVQPMVYETMSNVSTARMREAEPKIAAALAVATKDTRCQMQQQRSR